MDVKIQVKVSENMIKFLQQPINRREIEQAALDIDAIKFGEQGNLLQSINNQSSPEAIWKPLSEDYLNWKREMMGKEIPGEAIPPKTVIGDKIWIRTGKALMFIKTLGVRGAFKTAVIKWQGLYNLAIPLYQVFVKQIGYIERADEMRPLFEWYHEDIPKINNVFVNVVKKIKQRFASVTGGKFKNILDVNVSNAKG